MWLYFNKKGQLLEALEHGTPARSGATNFEIFAVFEGVDIDASYSNATIKLRKPDLDGSEYPFLLMEQKRFKYVPKSNNEHSNYFINNQFYNGYYFDFGGFNDSQETEVLLDTPGLWEAVIVLVGATRKLNVQGVATFNVEDEGYSQDATELSIDSLLNNIAAQMATKLNIKSTRYLRVLQSFSPYVEEGFPESEFSVGDIIFNKETGSFYILNSFDYEEGVNPAYYEFPFDAIITNHLRVGEKLVIPSAESVEL